MRIAIVSPYSWSYPGGVNRHVGALAEELLEREHDVRVLAPWDPPGRITRLRHRGHPRTEPLPGYVIETGPTFAFGANGAVSNIGTFPSGVTKLRNALRELEPDVVHVHEPLVPLIAADACSYRGAPVVGTFHTYSTKPVPNYAATAFGARRKFNQLHARIAVSQAAAWTGRRWFGGEYEVIPNGVDLAAAPLDPVEPTERLEIVFVGRAEERKGLPVLLTAFQALVEHEPARLTVVGVEDSEVRRYLSDPEAAEHIVGLGRVDEAELWERLHAADVLCAPSLSGESFGMILTEAFAAGTPVIASNIAGYRDVVTDGVDGVLVPPADPQRLAEELQRASSDRDELARMGLRARESAERFSWPRVAARVEAVLERVVEAPQPARAGAIDRAARRAGFVPIDGSPLVPARRLPSLEPEALVGGKHRVVRRVALGAAAVLGVILTLIAAQRIGVDTVVTNIVRSDLGWVLAATALMSASMILRATSWYAIARSALPGNPLRRRDVTSATMIGVLMSATLPARLGEPARAMVLARRSGRVRETFPVLLGTLVSQTVLNIAALAGLGVLIVSSTDLFHANTERLFIFSLVPLVLLIAVVLAPTLVRRTGSGRIARAAGVIRDALLRVRRGLVVFRDPRRGPLAAIAQTLAWCLQLLACFALFTALGLDHEPAIGIGAAAAVLFAVNVTAVVPATPSNIGVFQLATISVLTTGFGIGAADALAYGVILQAVEIATAVALGVPALVREGMTWSDLRLQALSAAPVRLSRSADETV